MFGSRRPPKGDPVQRKLDALREEEEKLAAQIERLQAGLPPDDTTLSQDSDEHTAHDSPSPRIRHALRAQRSRDRNLFIILFLILAFIIYWLSGSITS